MNGIKRPLIRISLFLALVLAIAPACKDDFDSSIPYAPTNFTINMANYNNLFTDGGIVGLTGVGYGGIIVINTGFGYYAYDAACPYEVSLSCLIDISGSPIGICPCCETQYNLLDGGYTISGPSAEPLKPYRVTVSGNNLTITNY